MSKERYQVTIDSPDKGLKTITVDAPDFDVNNAEISLLDLRELVDLLKKLHDDPLILVRTPQITSPQLETLFEAGAKAHRILPSEDKE